MANKKHNRKKQTHRAPGLLAQQQSLFQKKTTFDSFADLTEYAGGLVYSIARLREDAGITSIATLGTGFLVGNHRMMTCAHVIDDMTSDASRHKDGDIYIFVQRNHPSWYKVFSALTVGQNLFIDHSNDSAIIYLADEFYRDDKGNILRDPNYYLELDRSPARLGAEVGVLGYPMQNIGFTDDKTDININTIYLRADKGVVNTRYASTEEVAMYEFTMGFNPGNSGGPILDIKTGKVVAMVHAYRSAPINFAKENIPAGVIEGITEDTEIISAIRALYSLGLSSINYLPYEGKHQISFR